MAVGLGGKAGGFAGYPSAERLDSRTAGGYQGQGNNIRSLYCCRPYRRRRLAAIAPNRPAAAIPIVPATFGRRS